MTNTEDTLHPVAISQVMINFAASLGVNRDTCLAGTGMSEQKLHDGEAFITQAQEMRLIQNLIHALPDVPALGFQLGLQYNLATFGIWGFALRTSRTLREAVARARRYLPLSTAYCRVFQIEEGAYFGVGMDAESIPRPLRQFLMERDMATGFNLLKELSLSSLDIVAMEFQAMPEEHAQRIKTLCGCSTTSAASAWSDCKPVAWRDRCDRSCTAPLAWSPRWMKSHGNWRFPHAACAANWTRKAPAFAV